MPLETVDAIDNPVRAAHTLLRRVTVAPPMTEPLATVMSLTTDSRIAALRANLLVLSEVCPADHSNPSDCPLFAVRQMKPTDRWQWFHALTEADLAYLATYHHVCLTTKVQASPVA